MKFKNKFVVKQTINWNGVDKAGAANSTVAGHLVGLSLPSGAIITDAWIDVTTTFTSAGNDATIALDLVSKSDGTTSQAALVAATTIKNSPNDSGGARTIWNVGMRGTLITAPGLGNDGAHNSAVEVIDLVVGVKKKLSANAELKMTVAVEALTAGVMDVYIEYIYIP